MAIPPAGSVFEASTAGTFAFAEVGEMGMDIELPLSVVIAMLLAERP